MYQFWCSWEILLTVAVIHELRLKLEGGDKPSSFEALHTEFTLHPDGTSTYHLSSTYFVLIFRTLCVLCILFNHDSLLD